MTNSTQPSDNASSALSLEGRLLAHRLLLSQLLRLLPDPALRETITWLEARSIFQDGQEDPGAVPDPALSLELARADEFRHLMRLLTAACG